MSKFHVIPPSKCDELVTAAYMTRGSQADESAIAELKELADKIGHRD